MRFEERGTKEVMVVELMIRPNNEGMVQIRDGGESRGLSRANHLKALTQEVHNRHQT